MSTMRMDLGAESYDIIVERGCLARAGELLDLERRVLVVTDDGVPEPYAETVAQACAQPTIVTLPQGEGSKSLDAFRDLLETMLAAGFTRSDCVVAVGGGVVGDAAGFAAASFMRGIDFYNVPTTVLSQVDSSIGGKTAVNLDGVKNIVGAFHQPRRVLIDPDVLATLPARHWANGLAEALKMAATFDADLFATIERGVTAGNIQEVIERAIAIKKRVVEQDVHEAGLRRVLNFGHTLGHGIEAASEGELLHGECVGLGMIPMCDESIRERMVRALQALGLPFLCRVDNQAALEAIAHDKKGTAEGITVVIVDDIGTFRFDTMTLDELADRLRTIVVHAVE